MASAGPLGLTPEIDDFRRQFENLSAVADAMVAPLTDAQFHWKRAPSSWSVAQCLEHLNVTARLYLPFLDEAMPTRFAAAYMDRDRFATTGSAPCSCSALNRRRAFERERRQHSSRSPTDRGRK